MRPLAITVGGSDVAVQRTTIRCILQAARDGAVWPELREAVVPELHGIPQDAEERIAERLYEWVKATTRWVPDPDGHEWVQGVQYTHAHRFGDCDDLSAYLMACWSCVGLVTGLVACGPDNGGPYDHVYPVVWLDDRWVAADPSIPEAAFGEELDSPRRDVFPLNDERDGDVAALWSRAAALAGASTMPRQTEPDCTIPPGREYAVTHYLPVIPRPLWERYSSTGRWPGGIQKGLDDTASCWLNTAVVVDGTIIEPVEIAGFFPWGWYRYERADNPPQTEEPPDPIHTIPYFGVIDYGTTADLHAPGQVVWNEPPQLPDCPLPVPTIDLLLPYPYNFQPWTWPDGRVSRYAPGEFGSIVLRVPGTDHPLWSSGIGVSFLAREYLSQLGLSFLNAWNEARVHGHPKGFAMGIVERTWPTALFHQPSGDVIQPGMYTAAYATSHMQRCPDGYGCNFYPRNSGLGPGGEVIPWRWRVGGASAAWTPPGSWDVYTELLYPHVWGGSWMTWPTPFAQDGTNKQDVAPEAAHRPGGLTAYKDLWVLNYATGERMVQERPWSGDPPGTYLERYARTASSSATVIAPPSAPRLGGVRRIGRSSHDVGPGERGGWKHRAGGA